MNRRDTAESEFKEGADSSSKIDRLSSSSTSGAGREDEATLSPVNASDIRLVDGLFAGRWQIIGRLGQGGMSVVYKARDTVLNRTVAVKCLLAHLTANPTNLRRFQQEAHAAGNLNHANLVQIHDCDITDDGAAYLIMEFLDGRSLSDVIRAEGKLQPERTVEIFVQIARGLAHAHEHGIVHRDLKPSNIMLMQDKRGFDIVKVVDFGIAKLSIAGDGETAQALTQTGEIFGSPLYMSPEQCAGQKVDKRTDIYSLGCLMYETLTGSAPFVGANALDTMHRHQTESPASLVSTGGEAALLGRLDAVVMKCLQKNPDDRYQSMDELAGDLEKAALGSDSSWRFQFRGRRLKALRRIAKRLAVAAVIIFFLGCAVATFMLVSQLASLSKPCQYHSAQALLWPMAVARSSEPAESGPAYLSKKSRLDKMLGEADNRFLNGYSADPLQIARAEEKVGLFEFDNRHWTEAKQRFEKVLEIFDREKMPVPPKRGRLYSIIGACCYNAGDDSEAELALEKAVKLFIDNRLSYSDEKATEATLYAEANSPARYPLSLLVAIAEKSGQLDKENDLLRRLQLVQMGAIDVDLQPVVHNGRIVFALPWQCQSWNIDRRPVAKTMSARADLFRRQIEARGAPASERESMRVISAYKLALRSWLLVNAPDRCVSIWQAERRNQRGAQPDTALGAGAERHLQSWLELLNQPSAMQYYDNNLSASSPTFDASWPQLKSLADAVNPDLNDDIRQNISRVFLGAAMSAADSRDYDRAITLTEYALESAAQSKNSPIIRELVSACRQERGHLLFLKHDYIDALKFKLSKS